MLKDCPVAEALLNATLIQNLQMVRCEKKASKNASNMIVISSRARGAPKQK